MDTKELCDILRTNTQLLQHEFLQCPQPETSCSYGKACLFWKWDMQNKQQPCIPLNGKQRACYLWTAWIDM
ncbi:Hypothetical predicted protein [Podarcis lilfordi]|uniref:Uncharacterized protein n=1 Tax=Podarcis lilfordi TaxID=74358 RepID=A0AA35NWL1_9SAUR|nr:Hypothetical predicted protein [Podarcis lilfordi]